MLPVILYDKKMRNIRLATLAKIIIPGYLVCAFVIFLSFISYNAAIRERNEILHRTLEGLGGALVWQATPALNNAEARSDAMYVLLIFVIGITVLITLASLFIITWKLLPIRNLVNTATELSKEDEDNKKIIIPNDELGFLTRELAQKIKSLDSNMKLLEEAVDKANAASSAKSDFLSSMSHEIRTPMNAIIGMTTIAKNEKDPERINYALENIETASSHLLGVINDILDISKIEMSKLELSCINFNFSKMIDRVCNVISNRMQEKKQGFTLNIDPEIPPVVYGDDQRLAQVIINLLSNACKFTPEEGSVSLEAKLLNIQNEKCCIQVMVKDSGIGIAKEEQKNLFNKFHQAEKGISRKFGGTGLGLAISRSILEMMDGAIWVDSEPGKGSCFIFTAMLGIPDHIDGSVGIEESLKSAIYSNSDFSEKVILLVDDIEINLEIVCALLEPTGVKINTVLSGNEAVEAFFENPDLYDMILIDIHMPGMDGLTATKMIRAFDNPKASSIPIIAMTANVFKEDIDKCLEAGMNGHLGKPINMDDVMNVLSEYLGTQTE